MRFLLDTQAWLWMLAEPKRLGGARTHIEDGTNELVLSAVSSWEIAIKYGRGSLALPSPPEKYVPSRIRSSGVTPLAIEHSHTLTVASLPHHHNDPFDRLLIGQARLERLPILTADEIFAAYDVEVVPVG